MLSRAGPILVGNPVLVLAVLAVVLLLLVVAHLRRKLQEKTLLKLYAMDHSNISESAALQALRIATRAHPEGEMESSEDVGQLLAMLISMLGVKTALEIGTFTGVATLKIAENLPVSGKVVTIDVDKSAVDVGRPFFEQAKVANKIDVVIASAVQTCETMLRNGKEGMFDLAFIDADKANYPAYLDLTLKLVRDGGVIVFDNSMFSRKLPWNTHKEPYNLIHSVNERAKRLPNTTTMLLTIGDGTLVIFKHKQCFRF